MANREGDGVIDENDWVYIDTGGGCENGVGDGCTKVPVSGRESTIGITDTATVISVQDENGNFSELKVESGSSSNVASTKEKDGDNLGRQGWIQIK